MVESLLSGDIVFYLVGLVEFPVLYRIHGMNKETINIIGWNMGLGDI